MLIAINAQGSVDCTMLPLKMSDLAIFQYKNKQEHLFFKSL